MEMRSNTFKDGERVDDVPVSSHKTSSQSPLKRPGAVKFAFRILLGF
jgi:hypothetical protein